MLYKIAFLFCLLLSFNFESAKASILNEDFDALSEIELLEEKDKNIAFHQLLSQTQDKIYKAAYLYYFGREHYANDDIDSAIYYWQIGYNLLDTSAQKDTLLQHKLAYNCGILYQNNATYYSAIQQYKKAYKHVVSDEDLAKCNIKIGVCFQDLGEFTIAEYYLKWAYSTLKPLKTNNAIKLKAQALGAIGVLFDQTNQPDSALYYIEKRLETIQKLEYSAAQKLLIPTLMGKANAYFSKKEYEKAIKNYNESLNLAKTNHNYTFQFRNYCNLGLAYIEKGEDVKAISFLNKAKNIAQEEEDNTGLAAAINTFADIYFKNGNYKKATSYYFEAFNTLLENDINFSLNQIPSIASFKDIDDVSYVFQYLKFLSKSLVKQAQVEQSNDLMQTAIKYIHFSDSLLYIINQQNLDNQSRFFWREEANNLYALALEASIFLNQPEKQFFFIERGKYFVLRSLMNENLKLKQLSNNQQNEIAILKEKISKIEIKATSSVLDTDELIELIKAKEEYHELVSTVTSHNNEKELLFDEINLTQLQNNYLSNQSTLYISYLETDTITYAMYIDKTSSRIQKIKKDEHYDTLLFSFIKQISKPINTLQEQIEFLKTGNELYQLLIPFSLEQYNKLVINPSSNISYISFDALCNNLANKNLLINDCTISYTLFPSINLKQKSDVKRNKFLYIAPINFGHINMHDLPNSKTEVTSINKNIKGKILLAENASKEKFKTAINEVNNIHLATHSMANVEADELPWIAFSDSKMCLPEIYNLNLKISLLF